MNTVVIHHSADYDGLFCREIARKFLPEATLIGWDYGEPVPVILPSTQLYMLDISVDGLMERPGLIWIDHHKSAIEKYDHLRPRGWQIDGVAACRLAWQWFSLRYGSGDAGGDAPVNWPTKQDFIDRTVPEPLAVRLAGEYDIWDKRDPRAELFQHGLRSMDLTPHWAEMLSTKKLTIGEVETLVDAQYTDLIETDGSVAPAIVHALLANGRGIQYAQTRQNESIIKAYGFTVEFEGLKFLACNHARFNSHLFTAGLTPEHDACFGFNWDGKKWRVSLYHAPGKEHHDLSLIAVKHGGGGHRGACGFKLDKLPFDS